MKKATGAIGLVIAVVAGSAAADTMDATSTMSNFRYTLIDLDPDDGVAPSVEFRWDEGFTTTYAPDAANAIGGFANVERLLDQGGEVRGVKVTGSLEGGDLTFSNHLVLDTTMDPWVGVVAAARASTGSPGSATGVIISARTKLVMTADVSGRFTQVFIKGGGLMDAPSPFRVVRMGFGCYDRPQTFSRCGQAVDWMKQGRPNGPVTAVLNNWRRTDYESSFDVSHYLSAKIIPEPPTWGLALAGLLAVVGAVSRRRAASPT